MFNPRSPRTLKLSVALLFGLAALAGVPALAMQLGLFQQSESDIEPLTSLPSESSDPGAVAPVGNLQLEQAREFTRFPLFWVGEEYRGLPLTAIVRADYVSAQRPGQELREDSITFLYGKCVPPEGEGGCPAPFQVIVQPYCSSPPASVIARMREGEPFELRGAKAEQYIDGHLQLWTGPVSITELDHHRLRS